MTESSKTKIVLEKPENIRRIRLDQAKSDNFKKCLNWSG